MTSRSAPPDVPRYYAWLSRYQDAMRWLGHDTGRATFTVHRRLRDAAGGASGDVLHDHLLAALHATDGDAPGDRGATVPPTVLDAGCGLGGTSMFLHTHLGGPVVGLTLSPEQAARATAEAARRGIGASCRFVVRSYDAPLDDLLPGGADLIVAIESLAHAPDPAQTLGRLSARLRAGGRLVIVDDVPDSTLPDDDVDLAGFRRGWHAPAVASADALSGALVRAGLTPVLDRDLTPLLLRRVPGSLAMRLLVTRAVGPLARRTPARVLHDAMLGGLYLERMYARGVVRYRLIVARRRRA